MQPFLPSFTKTGSRCQLQPHLCKTPAYSITNFITVSLEEIDCKNVHILLIIIFSRFEVCGGLNMVDVVVSNIG